MLRYRVPVAVATVALLLAVLGLAVGSTLIWREKERTQDALVKADEAAERATAALVEAEWQAYLANVVAAAAYLKDGHPFDARRLLERCPPAQRGWEWSYPDVKEGSGRFTRLVNVEGAHEGWILCVGF